jgi:hypothetical protein
VKGGVTTVARLWSESRADMQTGANGGRSNAGGICMRAVMCTVHLPMENMP